MCRAPGARKDERSKISHSGRLSSIVHPNGMHWPSVSPDYPRTGLGVPDSPAELGIEPQRVGLDDAGLGRTWIDRFESQRQVAAPHGRQLQLSGEDNERRDQEKLIGAGVPGGDPTA